jgi:SAM-dependent methyltransferase
VENCQHLSALLEVLLPVQDILEGRVDEPEPPEWCEKRGWTEFLSSLSDQELWRCEAEGLAEVVPYLSGVPDTLQSLAKNVNIIGRLSAVHPGNQVSQEALRFVRARKQRQLGPLLHAVGPMAKNAKRIIDIGAGTGHFTRLAAEVFEREVVGLDRDPQRLEAAKMLVETRLKQGAEGVSQARFERRDAFREPLGLQESDLAVGLHACGAVGDQLVQAVAREQCDLALVSCCFQKIPELVRIPLSQAGLLLRLPKDILGLANLSSRPEGVETSLQANLAARQARFALYRLLRARNLKVTPGEAMRGINRRRAHEGFRALAQRALLIRGLSPGSEAELSHYEIESQQLYGKIRRFTLPRHLLSRLVELAVVLDRASCLEESGLYVSVLTLCAQSDTPRNVCIFASQERKRLPNFEDGMHG